ncbi:hypothetical protein K466DRAFT_59429 [Polyporus arcularius HHB13444]|uniref:Uncharacterized protein n=1 Tax=Polyporus arcularius HHB13444 TaxID=1314778 RepID=A0A5C3Q098_9APHY|nr:hypothetical protein K466DRAFT_59429 [Polyporus arcularius HHB13444]
MPYISSVVEGSNAAGGSLVVVCVHTLVASNKSRLQGRTPLLHVSQDKRRLQWPRRSPLADSSSCLTRLRAAGAFGADSRSMSRSRTCPDRILPQPFPSTRLRTRPLATEPSGKLPRRLSSDPAPATPTGGVHKKLRRKIKCYNIDILLKAQMQPFRPRPYDASPPPWFRDWLTRYCWRNPQNFVHQSINLSTHAGTSALAARSTWRVI